MRAMTTRMDRRRALGAMGTVSLAALFAGACSSDDTGSGSGDGAADSDASSTSSTSGTSGTSGTPVTSGNAGSGSSGSITAAMFDEAGACTVSPEQTEGPYYFDVDSIRTDIREDRAGTPLRLGVRVRDAGACLPLANAVVDIWHCDAEGSYSGFESASGGANGAPGAGANGGPGRSAAFQSDESTYLRGAQVTNADGIAEFLTIFPGWYTGRTVHIHAKVHLDKSTLLTTQLYFDEEVTAAAYEAAPYADRGSQDRSNASDGIFDERTLLTLSEDGDGYLGLITLDVDG
jgi:protocatechuate 3,4-dioxygenase beta subunit